VEYERFVYPDYDEPTMSAFDCAFEAAYIVLHPFLRLPDDLALDVVGYPDDEQIVMAGAKNAWALVGEQLGFSSYSKLDQALLTSIRAIKDEICDYDASASLERFLETNSIWMPANGGFDPLLRADYLSAFDTAGQPELVSVPEFPQLDKTDRHAVCDLRSGAATFPHRGTLVAPDCSFLFTVDWDSFFTLMFGPRTLLERIIRQRNLEGFFATRNTKHFWFKDAAESKVPK
jgi:hypothetical protein